MRPRTFGDIGRVLNGSNAGLNDPMTLPGTPSFIQNALGARRSRLPVDFPPKPPRPPPPVSSSTFSALSRYPVLRVIRDTTTARCCILDAAASSAAASLLPFFAPVFFDGAVFTPARTCTTLFPSSSLSLSIRVVRLGARRYFASAFLFNFVVLSFPAGLDAVSASFVRGLLLFVLPRLKSSPPSSLEPLAPRSDCGSISSSSSSNERIIGDSRCLSGVTAAGRISPHWCRLRQLSVAEESGRPERYPRSRVRRRHPLCHDLACRRRPREATETTAAATSNSRTTLFPHRRSGSASSRRCRSRRQAEAPSTPASAHSTSRVRSTTPTLEDISLIRRTRRVRRAWAPATP
eukprot:29692-Pelagococcus_subviridis.AAC.2